MILLKIRNPNPEIRNKFENQIRNNNLRLCVFLVWYFFLFRISTFVFRISPLVGLRSSQSAADAAVLAYAPEVDGNQQGHRQWDCHAVQHIEAQQRRLADEAPTQQQEAGVAARVDKL